MRKLYADRLNARSAGGKTDFETGDLVRIYVPPNQDEIERRERKAKHLYCWRGPCEVIEVLKSASEDSARTSAACTASKNCASLEVGDVPASAAGTTAEPES